MQELSKLNVHLLNVEHMHFDKLSIGLHLEASFLQLILDKDIISNNKDKWTVPGAPDNSYSTKMPWRLIRLWDRCNQSIGISGSQRMIWVWISLARLICPLCELREEDPKHLFLECSITAKYWQVLGSWWRISIPVFSRCEDPIYWSSFAVNNRIEGSWLRVVVNAILVSIWKLRNRVMFDKKKVNEEKDFRDFIELSFYWLNSRNPKFKKKLNLWVQNPNTTLLEGMVSKVGRASSSDLAEDDLAEDELLVFAFFFARSLPMGKFHDGGGGRSSSRSTL
ncbi:hypothetical protein LXL04_001764 [Taraxacum kok-saghyz]